MVIIWSMLADQCSLFLFISLTWIKRFYSHSSLPPPGLLGNNPGQQIHVGSSNLWLGCTGCWVNDHALLNRCLLSIRKSVPYQHQKQHRRLLDSRSGLCCSCLDTPGSNHGLLHPCVHPDSFQPRSQHEQRRTALVRRQRPFYQRSSGIPTNSQGFPIAMARGGNGVYYHCKCHSLRCCLYHTERLFQKDPRELQENIPLVVMLGLH